jgi:3',5'-cyclic AMP phosphodiesterase CpdA
MPKYSEPITIIHISDLHFGSILANNQFPVIGGWAAHDFRLCRGLPLTMEYIRATLLELGDADEIRVVASGDLTATGTQQEFAVAHSYLRSRLRLRRPPPGRETGLVLADNEIAAVPGNHDHWDGKTLPRPTAYTKSIFPRYFRKTPWMKAWVSLGGALELEVYGIDSNSGFEHKKTNFRAKGEFSGHELQILEQLLKESDLHRPPHGTSRVRALVTHHSLTYTGRFPGIISLEDSSRDRIVKLAAEYKIGAILTGHTHESNFHKFTVHVTNPPLTRDVWELRAATTFQGPSGPNKQGFWCHLIRTDAGGPFWTAWRFQWDGNAFRCTSGTPDVDFPMPTV